MKIQISAAIAALAMLCAANAAPPIEAYGELPSVRSLDISPDGKHFAFLSRKDEGDYFVIAEYGKGAIGGGSTRDVKARTIYFTDDEHAVIIASETTGNVFWGGKWENSSAFSFNIKTNRFGTLLKGYDDLYQFQGGLGRIIGKADDEPSVFMPAYIGSQVRVSPFYGLLKANLNSSSAKLVSRGSKTAFDWFVNPNGVILAREDFDDRDNTYRVFTEKGGDIRLIYQEKGVDVSVGAKYSVIGVMPDDSALVVASRTPGQEYSELRKMSFDGTISEPIFNRDDATIVGTVKDLNRRLLGVRYGGVRAQYGFFDQSLANDMNSLAGLFTQDVVRIAGWTEDKQKILIEVEGGATTPSYMIYDRDSKQIARLAQKYELINDDDINPVYTIEYKARDGLKIPAIVTFPRGTGTGQKLPLIVIPHGGPSSHDEVGFDWMAQYFASRGYLVLQPNFRGSDGFGSSFLYAGYGEWGRKMQDDITDGVELLTRKQWADPARVCIVGGSYGGYAALAGGAFTPDNYKCVIAIAPVADLKSMLQQIKINSGSSSGTYEYWSKLIGDIRSDAAGVEAISPADHANAFKAPVLLIHGKDDSVVPYVQSLKMRDALKASGKSVELVTLKEEDHWLSKSDTRLQTLKAMDSFVRKTIGPSKAAAP
ncbi:MAG: prolyl oligopeptidase family serine peptidase [Parvularculaceae bacterium]